jgi:hypothetical protein
LENSSLLPKWIFFCLTKGSFQGLMWGTHSLTLLAWLSSTSAFQEDVAVSVKATEKEGMTVMHMINSHSKGQNTVVWLDHTGQHLIWKINILCEHLTSLTQNVILLLKFIYFEYNTKEKKSVFYFSLMLFF